MPEQIVLGDDLQSDLTIPFSSEAVACLAAEVWRRRGIAVGVERRGARWFVVENEERSA